MEIGDKKRIFDNPMHPYTKALLSAVPVSNPDVKMNRIILKGDIPVLLNRLQAANSEQGACMPCQSVLKNSDFKRV